MESPTQPLPLEEAKAAVQSTETVVEEARRAEQLAAVRIEEVEQAVALMDSKARTVDPDNEKALRALVADRGALDVKRAALEARHDAAKATTRAANAALYEAEKVLELAERADRARRAAEARGHVDELVLAFNDVAAPSVAILRAAGKAEGLNPALSPLDLVAALLKAEREEAERAKQRAPYQAEHDRLARGRHQNINVYESAAQPPAPTRATEAEQRRELSTILHSTPDEPGSYVGE